MACHGVPLLDSTVVNGLAPFRRSAVPPFRRSHQDACIFLELEASEEASLIGPSVAE
jgi:hypothetical protein